MYKENTQTIISYNDNIEIKIKTIKDLIKLGTKEPQIIEAARQCQNSINIYHCVLQFAYNSAVMQPSPQEYQQFKTVRYILKHKTANCTGYVTIIGSILTVLNIPFTLRVTGDINIIDNSMSWYHIYIIAGGFVLDATQGQDQNGKSNFENRKLNATFNHEIFFPYKKDYHINMITVLNGNRNINADPVTMAAIGEILEGYKDPVTGRYDVQGMTTDIKHILSLGTYGVNTIMTMVNQYFNPCKRGCDLKHPLNQIKRMACKRACIRQSLATLSPQELQKILDYTSARNSILTNPNLILFGIVGFAIYQFTKN
jgi:hypothetical protein